ncbi:MAG: hypothetical protein US11_C0001G0147 [Candidatus Roizmanbacteria bacterium GW2011_GWA2_36_23]|uniref:Uncharacterized protein n=1 Tax=Candidatus Roizmanbacteria bacterium GW2011_GWA2_36_23 TaxID=1618480 RepID=A0A0G0E5J2_9BACT|nr:MAG: hypothetical protein US11_C0001G0147 [Candidatus Roizmanbacteria bacterium GW2011_GWA2_36_23]
MYQLNVKKIFTKRNTDYSFAILFLLIFSFFIIFAIRPSLSTAASLQKEEIDLKRIDALYENQIINIATIQNYMEKNRDEFHLLSESIPQYPKVNKIIQDINQIATNNSISIIKANIGEVNLIDSNKKAINSLQLNVTAEANFEEVISFIRDLFKQRRLKTISRISIASPSENIGSGSARLNIIIKIVGYYL